MSDAHEPGERVITEEQREYLETWCRNVADGLGLRDWRVRVSAYISRDGSYASSFIRDRSDSTEIAVDRDFVSRPPDEQRATLVHELLHPHLHRLTQLAAELIEHELGKRTEAVIETAIAFHEELVIERLANAIAHNFPPVQMPPASPADTP